jgi:hypothetical protein
LQFSLKAVQVQELAWNISRSVQIGSNNVVNNRD